MTTKKADPDGGRRAKTIARTERLTMAGDVGGEYGTRPEEANPLNELQILTGHTDIVRLMHKIDETRCGPTIKIFNSF